MLRWSIVVVYVIFMCGCAPEKLREPDIIGNYYIHYAHGDEWLKLSKDNVYVQVYSGLGATSNTINKGRWDLNHNNKTVVLKEVLFFSQLDGSVRSPPARGEWGLSVHKTSDGYKLLICEDLQYYFRRTNSIPEN